MQSSTLKLVLLPLFAAPLIAAPTAPSFGPNVYIFDSSMSTSQIQTTVDTIANQQVGNQFGTQRYALLFKPGTYGADTPLNIQVGYYTDVMGLGASPTDTVINGHVDVYNQCFGNNCVGLDNFWRSVQNLTINVKGGVGCHTGGNGFWAVSQAAPMRRVNYNGNLFLFDYCSGPGYVSGGFISDSQLGLVVNGGQQQFLTRSSIVTNWTNGVWNQVFSGVTGAPTQSFPNPPYTTLPTSPITRERPFLYVDSAGNWNVFVPAVQTNSSGTTWASGSTAGASIPIADFLIATPATPVSTITSSLSRGGNVIFTPGVYQLNAPIVVTKPDAVLLGLGFATLSPQTGNAAMKVNADKGVKIAGLLFDAGPVNSPVLLDLGTPSSHKSDPSDPTTLNDVFFRIGGPAVGKATNSLVVESDNVLLDDIWAWRADHGTGVGWTLNTADHGVIVNGDNVIAYGLFVEHYQKEEVFWNGENGETIMFQNEMPYDPPNQASWMDGVNPGFPAYKVADQVNNHTGYGMGSYCNFVADPNVQAVNAFQTPTAPGIHFQDLLTISLNFPGIIEHVINDTGAATPSGVVPVNIISYP